MTFDDTSAGLTPGDPLGGGARPPQAPPPAGSPTAPEQAPPLWTGDRPGAGQGYTSPAPPGAGGPPWSAAQAPGGAVAGRWVLAGWWRRVGAQLIDGVIVGIGAALLLILITAPFSVGFFASEEAGVVSVFVGLFLAVICISIVALLYAPALMARTNGQTLGRKATGIRVVRADGAPMTFGFAMLREVAVKALLFGIAGSLTAGIANLVDVLWPLWDEENRALHDFIVNTRTVMD